jgi:excisionase family DNA binding protein
VSDRFEQAEESLPLSDRLALRPKEAAKALGLSERALRSLLPRLPHVRAGTAVLLPIDALRRWLDEQAQVEGDRVDRAVEEALESLKR